MRRAIAHVVDIPTIIDTVFRGHAHLTPSVIGPNQPAFHDPSILSHPCNVDLANNLLNEAGHPRGADGIRFAAHILHNPFSDYPGKIAEYLRSTLEHIGITGEVVNYDYTTYVAKI